MEPDKKLGILIPTGKEVENIISKGKPKQRAALYLRHTTTRYLFWKPLLSRQQEKQLQDLITEGEGYGQYLALYKRNQLFNNLLGIVEKEFFKAKYCLARLWGCCVALNQQEAAEEVANTFLEPFPEDERRRLVNLAAATSSFYGSYISPDEEGFLKIAAIGNESPDFLPFNAEEAVSLGEQFKSGEQAAQYSITSFLSSAAGFKDFAQKVVFPFTDLYLKMVGNYEESIRKDRTPGLLKYNVSGSLKSIKEHTGKEIYIEPKRLEMLKKSDISSFQFKPEEEEREKVAALCLQAWEAVTGLKY